jgi:hypothetical protein
MWLVAGDRNPDRVCRDASEFTVNGAAAKSNFTLLRIPSQPVAPLNAADFTV